MTKKDWDALLGCLRALHDNVLELDKRVEALEQASPKVGEWPVIDEQLIDQPKEQK